MARPPTSTSRRCRRRAVGKKCHGRRFRYHYHRYHSLAVAIKTAATPVAATMATTPTGTEGAHPQQQQPQQHPQRQQRQQPPPSQRERSSLQVLGDPSIWGEELPAAETSRPLTHTPAVRVFALPYSAANAVTQADRDVLSQQAKHIAYWKVDVVAMHKRIFPVQYRQDFYNNLQRWNFRTIVAVDFSPVRCRKAVACPSVHSPGCCSTALYSAAALCAVPPHAGCRVGHLALTCRVVLCCALVFVCSAFVFCRGE